jgi:hypothetical protein
LIITVDARISGEVRRVIHRRYHIHVYRFESCPDYKIINVMKQLIKQSIIGALYMFMIAAMGAVVVVALYTMAGR